MRIVGVDPERRFSGGESQVIGLARGLLAAGHSAELLCDPAGQLYKRAASADIPCHPLKIRNSLDLRAGLRLRRFLKAERFDIVHFHTARAHALAPFARGCARALVVTRRMDYPPSHLLGAWLYNRAVDAVAAISSGVRDSLVSSGVDPRRITIIASGIECGQFRPAATQERESARAALGLGPREVALGALGALESRKGHRLLLDAMSRILNDPGRASGSRWRCFIAGAGSLGPELRSQAAQLGLGDAVTFTGPLTDPRQFLFALDIFVLPSLKEGLGVALLEAMACGLPAVASAVGGVPDAVEHERTGLLVPPGSAPELAGALARLIASPAERRAMGAAARLRALEHFRVQVMTERTLQFYGATLATAAAQESLRRCAV